jgi:hypothetical protein
MATRDFHTIMSEYDTALIDLHDLKKRILENETKLRALKHELLQASKAVDRIPQSLEPNTDTDSLLVEGLDLEGIRRETGGFSIRLRADYIMRRATSIFNEPPRNVDLGKAIWITKFRSYEKFGVKEKNSLSGQISTFIRMGMIDKYVATGNENDVRLLPSNWEALPNSSDFSSWIKSHGLEKVNTENEQSDKNNDKE